MAAVNYDDERFQQVTAEQNQAIENVQNTYNQMINQADQFYQRQAQAAEDYGNKQAEIQQANTDFAIEKINQQKEQAQKDYTKEQKGAYVDWQKQSNRYGVNAELQAQQGLRNGGYSESSQVSMYNQYQNRVAQSRDSYNRAVLNYDNSIKEAQLTNNAKLAEIAYQALQTSLEINLNGFQYKNQLMTNQINALNAEKDRYYTRWQDVLKQVNYENEQAENLRRYEEQMALERQQLAASQARVSSGSGSKTSSNNTYSLNTASEGIDNSNITIGGKTFTPTNNAYEDANGEYRVYKYNGKLYWYDGVNMNPVSGDVQTTSNGSLLQNVAKAASAIKSKTSSVIDNFASTIKSSGSTKKTNSRTESQLRTLAKNRLKLK